MAEGVKQGKGAFFDPLATDYDAWFDGAGKQIFAIELEAFKKVLSLLPKPWLEIGVGSGRFAEALGIETGIDPSKKMLAIAAKRGIKTFLARGEEHIFHLESFGTVFLIVTLCFVDSPFAVMQEIYSILKPEGRLTLGMILRESPWGKAFQEKKEKEHPYYKHATFCSYHEVTRLLEDTGFALEKVISTLFQPPGGVHDIEFPREGYSPDAGFTIIVARKTSGAQ